MKSGIRIVGNSFGQKAKKERKTYDLVYMKTNAVPRLFNFQLGRWKETVW